MVPVCGPHTHPTPKPMLLRATSHRARAGRTPCFKSTLVFVFCNDDEDDAKASHPRPYQDSHSKMRSHLPNSMIVLLTLSLSICVALFLGRVRFEDNDTKLSNQHAILLNHPTPTDSRLTIYPGELPGYTGWSRPEHTMVSYYKIIETYPSVAIEAVKDEWNVTIACTHYDCRHGGAHFYVRLYGPTVLAGTVQDHSNGLYTIRSWPMDGGHYTVEVVLAFSGAPDWHQFPLERDLAEPAYEGYMVPGFPLGIHVNEPSPSPSKELCSLHELTDYRQDRPGDARWVVTDKVASRSHQSSDNSSVSAVSLLGYQDGQNSIGIRMDYVRRSCSLLPLPTSKGGVSDCLLSSTHQPRSTPLPIHIIFVGDSNLRMQQKLLANHLTKRKTRTTLVSTSNGIVRTFSNVTSELTVIASSQTERRFVLFNTGLHDISQLCSRKWSDKRQLYMNVSDAEFSCTDEYRRQVSKLVDFVGDYPAELKVFQSTTAGWPKYGNFGFAWPPSEEQPFPLSPNFVAHLNDIAYEIIQQHNLERPGSKILIMDGYWITLSRPDNREVNIDNVIGKHMVHPGNEVLQAMVRIWWMMILRAVSSNCLGTG